MLSTMGTPTIRGVRGLSALPLLQVPPTTSSPSASTSLWPAQAGLMTCLVLACLVGEVSRPMDYLAALWPANALMLGLLLRKPALGQSVSTWLLAWMTLFVMDVLLGGTLFVAVVLNVANVLGVLTAWLFLRRQRPQVLHFQRQRSVSVLFAGCLLGAASCTLLGAWGSYIAFDVPLMRAAALWLSGEFFSYILLVPVMLAAPAGWFWHWRRPVLRWRWQKMWPLLALVASEGLSLLIGGPGAIAFLMPAMVWCAMTYRLFTVTLLNVLMCFGKAVGLVWGAVSFTPEHVMDAISYRTGLALLSLAPLAVACAYGLRLQALDRLHHAVNHDFLTGTLARRALIERGQKLLSRLKAEEQPVAVLMADLDHFKRVNDCYGHAQGDLVLQTFAAIAHEALRPEDLLGRMGGEEFVIVLPRTNLLQALSVGNRLCHLMRQHVFTVDNGTAFSSTVSVGLHAVSVIGPHDSLEQLLSKADTALYMAKNNGRDQVHQYGPVLASSSV